MWLCLSAAEAFVCLVNSTNTVYVVLCKTGSTHFCLTGIRVVVNGAQSSWLPVLSGIPQCTILGPLLFLIYINYIVLGIDSEIRLFADDCIVYRQICNSCDSVSLQSHINKLHEWTNKWQMSFNVSRCCILSIHRKRTPPTLNYTLGNTLLNVVNSHSYLGVTVTSDLHAHASMLTIYQSRLPKLSTSFVTMYIVVLLI